MREPYQLHLTQDWRSRKSPADKYFPMSERPLQDLKTAASLDLQELPTSRARQWENLWSFLFLMQTEAATFAALNSVQLKGLKRTG